MDHAVDRDGGCERQRAAEGQRRRPTRRHRPARFRESPEPPLSRRPGGY
jgi:hypothetical protein